MYKISNNNSFIFNQDQKCNFYNFIKKINMFKIAIYFIKLIQYIRLIFTKQYYLRINETKQNLAKIRD